jgi:hypothetical protein
MFKRPTIRELSDYIKRVKDYEYSPIEPVEEKDAYALSSAQKRLYILQQMNAHNLSYNMPQAVILEGRTGKEKLESTFRQLIRRHESLRTSFHIVGEEPVQVVHSTGSIDFLIEYHQMAEAGATETVGMDVEAVLTDFVRAFDLSQAPLLRVELIQLENEKHLLLMDMHHIITDGTSLELFVKEIKILYAGQELPPLKIQYKDYSQWQNRETQRQILKQQEEYWKSQFEGGIPLLNLPTDCPRSEVRSVEGDWFGFNIEKEVITKLRDLALEQDMSLYMLLLAIFYVFLYKLSGQEDIIVGTDTAGRGRADLQNIVGMFVNTLALRNYPTGEKKFTAFLEEIKTRTLEAFENQDFQFEEIVEQVIQERDLSRNPLFDVAFYYLHTVENSENIQESEISISFQKEYQLERKATLFDLSLSVIDSGMGLSLAFEYCTKLFNRKKIETLATLFNEVLAAILENRNIRLEEIHVSHHLLVETPREIHVDDLEF